MDDRKKRVQSSKNFFDEFLKLMNHYSLLDENSKRAWKFSMHPEESRDAPKVTPQEDRANKIEEFKRKKLIEQQIEKLKNSTDDGDIKEFWLNMLNLSIIKAIAGLKSIDLEFQLLVYRDSLPLDQRGPPEAPKEKKPIEMFHIPKGALDGQSYMFGDGQVSQVSAAPTSNVVKTYQETGERVTVNTSDNSIDARLNLREQMKAQVFQPHWNQPTMTIEEFGEMEYQDMKRREREEKERMEFEEAKDEETREEEERLKLIVNDNMKDEIPKGYGHTKRL